MTWNIFLTCLHRLYMDRRDEETTTRSLFLQIQSPWKVTTVFYVFIYLVALFPQASILFIKRETWAYSPRRECSKVNTSKTIWSRKKPLCTVGCCIYCSPLHMNAVLLCRSLSQLINTKHRTICAAYGVDWVGILPLRAPRKGWKWEMDVRIFFFSATVTCKRRDL